MELELVVQFLNDVLDIPEFPDYDNAWNGLQVTSSGPVRRVAAAVDASVQSIQAAVDRQVDLLLVHHGIYWDGVQPLTGRRFQRVAPLVRENVGLYAAHLPLDAHPELGNCVQLIRALGLEPGDRFGRYRDRDIGFATEVGTDRESFRAHVAEVVGGPVQLIPGGPTQLRRIGVVTGGGGSFVRDAAEAGLDALLTGEGAHHTALDAREYGVNILYAGHYATETWGVRALAARLEEACGPEWEFLDFPTGL